MTSTWDFFLRSTDGVAASHFVDIGIAAEAPLAEKPVLLRVEMDINEPQENGFPTAEEFRVLYAIEERFLQELEQTTLTDYVGRVTCAGILKFFYYGSEKDAKSFRTLVESVAKEFAGYCFRYREDRDPEWACYFRDLSPSPLELQLIQNRHVLAALSERGDRLITPREVRHWLYFATENDRKRFIESMHKFGFRDLVTTERNRGNNSPSHLLVIARNESVDHESIDETVRQLFMECDSCGGEYDGWETKVVVE